MRSPPWKASPSARSRGHANRLAATARDASEWTEATAASLTLASEIVVAVREAVVGALSELAGIIGSLFDIGLASLNPLDKWRKPSDLADHVGAYVDVIETLMERMLDSFGEPAAPHQRARPPDRRSDGCPAGAWPHASLTPRALRWACFLGLGSVAQEAQCWASSSVGLLAR
ncbi:hypothetical protein [Demequina litorisediminis]|uniref:hypothetical protein n=1 Tax=Demequina litorisediminis TaxID=1849022 RepID=UPI0024E18695|nr:hypothetical protein [Demequina litorisediminis]